METIKVMTKFKKKAEAKVIDITSSEENTESQRTQNKKGWKGEKRSWQGESGIWLRTFEILQALTYWSSAEKEELQHAIA